MVHFSGYEFTLTAFTLSWLVGFAPVFARRARWRWPHAVGLALVTLPFAFMALGFLDDVLRSFERYQATGTIFQVLRPAAASYLWATVTSRVFWYAALPLVGLALAHGLWARDTRETTLEIQTTHNLAPRDSWRRDAARGLALFFGIAIAYLAAYYVSTLIPATAAGADESQYWRNVTIPLIVLLSIVPALTEELLFRGILLGALARRMPWWRAALLQALFFGLVHAGYGSWTHVVAPLAFGLGMAWIVREVGWSAAAILHAEVNTLFFVIAVWPDYVAANGTLGVVGLGALVGIPIAAGAWALFRTRGDAYVLLWRSLYAWRTRTRERANTRT